MATEGGCDLVGSGNVHIERMPEVRHEIVNDEEPTRKWRLLLENEIDKSTEVPPVLRVVYDRLLIIWKSTKT